MDLLTLFHSASHFRVYNFAVYIYVPCWGCATFHMSCMKLCWSNSSRLSVSFCLLLSLTYSRVSYHVFQYSRVGTGELEEPENLPKLVHLVDVPRFDDAHLQVQDKQSAHKVGYVNRRNKKIKSVLPARVPGGV